MDARTIDRTGARAASAFSTYAEVDAHLVKARQLRAEATAELLRRVARGAARRPRAVLARFARWQQGRRTYHALMGCSDRVLADIGIEREHVALIAKGLNPFTHETLVDALRRRWASARARLAAAQAARRERRRIYRELMAYSDGELDELGVRRPDIAGIARGESSLRPAA